MHKGKLRSDFRVVTPTLTASVRGTEIKDIASEGYYWGDHVRMGSRGLLLLQNRTGKGRYLAGREGTDGSLLPPSDFMKKMITVTTLPVAGATDAEVFRSVHYSNFGSSLPGDLGSSRSPSGTRRVGEPRGTMPSRVDVHVHVSFPDHGPGVSDSGTMGRRR